MAITTDKEGARIATIALLETAEFAASIIDQLLPRLGKDSLAGQAIEAAQRLKAGAALFREKDPALGLDELRQRVLKAFGLGEENWGGPYSAYSLGVLKFEAETLSDAMVIMERMGPINATSTTTYTFSPRPCPEDWPRAWQNKRGEPDREQPKGDYFPYWATVDPGNFQGKDRGVTLHFYVKSGDVVAEVRVKVKDSKPIYINGRRVDFVGGHRYENVMCHGYRESGHFTRAGRMYSSPEYINSYVLLP